MMSAVSRFTNVCLLTYLGLFFLASSINGTLLCTSHEDCGWNSLCVGGTCTCVPGFSISSNGEDCLDDKCSDSQCLECSSTHLCNRCLNFIEEKTGRCLDSCSALYNLVIEGEQRGRVCPEGGGGVNKTYLAIILGACAGAILTALICLILYWKLKTASDRKSRLEFMQKMMDKQRREKDSQLRYLGSDNMSFDSTHSLGVVGVRSHYARHLEELRPHRQDFLAMHAAAKLRLTRLTATDSQRAATYRNIVHQLGRVITVLTDHKAPMPDDGHALLVWAEKVLTQFLRAQSSPHPSQRSYTTINSTFKPDLQLDIGDDEDQIDHSTPRYKYHRTSPAGATPMGNSIDSLQQDREVAEISVVQLLKDNDKRKASVV